MYRTKKYEILKQVHYFCSHPPLKPLAVLVDQFLTSGMFPLYTVKTAALSNTTLMVSGSHASFILDISRWIQCNACTQQKSMQSFMGFHQSLQFFLELQDDICGLINMIYCTSDLQVLYLFYLALISWHQYTVYNTLDCINCTGRLDMWVHNSKTI